MNYFKLAIIAITLILMIVPPSFAFGGMGEGNSTTNSTPISNNIEWNAPVSGKLYLGNELTNEDFKVKAVLFPSGVMGFKDVNGNIVPETNVEPSVSLNIYKDNILIKQLILNLQSEPFIELNYGLKVSATGFPTKNAKEWVLEYYNPWAIISIQTTLSNPNFTVVPIIPTPEPTPIPTTQTDIYSSLTVFCNFNLYVYFAASVLL